MANNTYAAYRLNYAQLWADMEILPSRRSDVQRSAARILAVKTRYKAIEAATSVPWWFVAIIHKMEADCDFNKHLHNGDSLQKRTWQVPAGRPKGNPPFTWEESAIDALTMPGKQFHKVTDWSLEHVAYLFEKFNGFGYRKRGIPSPYLWSFTNRYTQGKYVKDGVFSPTAVSTQSGAMALLKQLMQMDSSIVLRAREVPSLIADETETLPKAKDESLIFSRTIYGLSASLTGLVWGIIHWLGWISKETVELAVEIATESQSILGTLTTIGSMIGLEAVVLGFVAVGFGIIVALTARIDANNQGKIG